MRCLLLGGASVAAIMTLLPADGHAQWAVADALVEVNSAQSLLKDIEIVNNGITTINNQVRQIEQLTQTINAVAHGNVFGILQLATELSGIGFTDPIGNDFGGVMQVMAGAAQLGGNLGSLAQTVDQSTRVFTATGSDFRALTINQAATQVANQLALAQTIGNTSRNRVSSIQTIMTAAGNAPDVKAATDANARLTGELAVQSAQTNQLLSMQVMQAAQRQADEQREAQIWRCSAEHLVADAGTAMTSAGSGSVNFAGSNTASSACNIPATTVSAPSSGTTGDGNIIPASVTANVSGDDGGVTNTMLSQSWGSQASANATSMGVNPTALAATCVLESGCSNVAARAGSTVSGAFQMTDGTYTADLNSALTQNPSLSSQVVGKTDMTTQAIAATQDLKNAATSLQAAGIANPTVLDARGYYNFGAKYGATIATADGSQLMASLMPTYSASQLAANGISSTTTVAAWRSSVSSKLGGAATQSVLLGTNT